MRENIGMNLQGRPKMPLIFYKWDDQHEDQAKKVVETDKQCVAQETNAKYEKDASK